jgi:PilZ domain-containing protein
MKNTSKIKYAPKRGLATTASPRKEVRCAVRFPLSLDAVLSADKEKSAVLTRNVSASGVLLEVHDPLQVGQGIDFSIRMPGSILGAPSDVMVQCHGRVVRCSLSQGLYQAAATIDEYRFAEQ